MCWCLMSSPKGDNKANTYFISLPLICSPLDPSVCIEYFMPCIHPSCQGMIDDFGVRVKSQGGLPSRLGQFVLDADEKSLAPCSLPFYSYHFKMADSPSMAAAGPSQVPSTSLAERDKKRVALRRANLNIWQNGPKPPSGPLDSNMKKNTGFIKRVRQSLGAESKDQLLKEIETLNLEKYIDELVQAVTEGLGKCTGAKDCIAAAEVRKFVGIKWRCSDANHSGLSSVSECTA
jgi:hypothetical protein